MRRTFTPSGKHLFAVLGAAGLLLAAACSQNAIGPSAGLPPAGARVATSFDRSGAVAPPNDAWDVVPGTLHASFAAPLRASQGPATLRLSLPYPENRSTEVFAARSAIVSATYANGTSLRWPQPATFDMQRRLATVEIPRILLDGATGVSVALGVDKRGRVKEEPPGPRYWDGRDWKKTGTIVSGKHTVVLIHGIFSSVETAFPTGYIFKCPNDIAKAQGFDQVLGFDYDWFDPPQPESKLFAAFLQQVVAAKPSSLTIEAHSYGSLVTLAALPKIGSDANIANVVTLGGPLPLRGTPLGEPKNRWRMSMMFGLLDWYLDFPPDVVDKAFDSGMVDSLATNSDALKQILSDYKGMKNKPHFVQAAGTAWICFIPGIRSCNYSEETFKKILVDGTGVQLPWDGVVETIAATSTDIPDAVATPFPLSHVELECKSSVINWVAKQLK